MKRKIFRIMVSVLCSLFVWCYCGLEIHAQDVMYEHKGYYYNTLDMNQKRLYEYIYTKFVNYEPVVFNSTTYNNEYIKSNILKITNCIRYDYPLLFQQPTHERIYVVYSEDPLQYGRPERVSYASSYVLDAKEVSEKADITVAKAKEIIDLLDIEGMSEYDKALAIYDYLACSVDYYSEDLDEWEFESFRSLYGALVEGKANCVGYAQAYQYLCQMAGLDCIVVQGEIKDKNNPNLLSRHVWNAIKINGKWRFADVCWAPVAQNVVLHKYFYVTREFLEENRYSFRITESALGPLPDMREPADLLKEFRELM